jgi:hypothetical protein
MTSFDMKSAPKDGRWIFVFGIECPIGEQAEPGELASWYRVTWTAEAEGESGQVHPGYWDTDHETWLLAPVGWMPIPAAPYRPAPVPAERAEINKNVSP